jgi:hypothetical protein
VMWCGYPAPQIIHVTTALNTAGFLPRKSSSAVPVKCADPKCKDLCGNEWEVLRKHPELLGACPDYALQYGTGNTTGHLLTETLTLPLEDGGTREIKNFGVGCSVVSSVFLVLQDLAEEDCLCLPSLVLLLAINLRIAFRATSCLTKQEQHDSAR